MAQTSLDQNELVNSFFLALEEGQTMQDLEILGDELKEFGVSDEAIGKAQAEASRLFAKNCF